MSELDEDVELTLERKRAILDLFQRLDELSYYELLGVAIGADKKEIKRAYYELAPEFHPDKYFRKRLGSFKPKIETIFARITLAHDVLTHRTRRAEYDTYLEQVLKNRAMAAWMEQAPPPSSPTGAAPSPAVIPAPPPSTPRPSPAPAPPQQPQPRAAVDPEAAAEIDRIRRQTLARKLSGGLRRFGSGVMPAVSDAPSPNPPPARPTTPSMTATPPPGSYSWSAAASGELEQLLRVAAAASARGDFVAEADALRAAVSLAPLNGDIRRRSRDAQVRAAGALAHGYLKQADYEAGEARWAEASWSYVKAASLLPRDARPHERVAFATLAMGGSPQRAVEFARRAVELAPHEAALRITLGRAYLAAGQEASGLGELEQARALAPDDPHVVALAAELIEQVRRRAR